MIGPYCRAAGQPKGRRNFYRSLSASGIFSWISGGRDSRSVAQKCPQLAHVTDITVRLFTTSLLPVW